MNKKELQQYISLRLNIRQTSERIEELEAAATKQTAAISGEPGGGLNLDKIGDTVARMADLKTELQRKLQEALTKQIKIEKAIEDLPEREKYLIVSRYIEGKTWEAICVDMNYQWAQIHRIHANALQLLNRKHDTK